MFRTFNPSLTPNNIQSSLKEKDINIRAILFFKEALCLLFFAVDVVVAAAVVVASGLWVANQADATDAIPSRTPFRTVSSNDS